MRKLLLFLIVIIVGITFIARLFYLQVFSSKAYNIYDDNAIRKVFHYPKRGYVYDRNGKLLVANQPSYDVMVIPNEVMPLDTLEFCSLLNIEKEQYTPLIKYVETDNVLIIEGKSISEDPLSFYQPLFNWTNEFLISPFELTVDFNLEYFNTASSKMIYDFVKKIFEADIKPKFIWKYMEDDEDIEDCGSELDYEEYEYSDED